VSAAGADVEMNTPGSAVVQTKKSGGNIFKTLTNITYEADNFVGNNIDDGTRARGFTGQRNLIFWEGHADFGGPLVKDRVWFFCDALLGLFGYGWPMKPRVDFHDNPPRHDTGTDFDTGAGWLVGNAGGPFNADRNKPQLYVKGTYFLPDKLGSHDLKLGFEWQDDQSVSTNNGNSGPILYLDRNGLVDEIRLTDFNTFESFKKDWTGNDDRNMRHAAYIQDRWA